MVRYTQCLNSIIGFRILENQYGEDAYGKETKKSKGDNDAVSSISRFSAS